MKISVSVFSIVIVTLFAPVIANAQLTAPPAIELSEPPPPLPTTPKRNDAITPEHSHSHDGHVHERETGPHGGRMVRLEDGVVVELVYDPHSRSVTVHLPGNDRRDDLSFSPKLSEPVPHCDGGSCQLERDDRTGHRLDSYLERESIYRAPPRLHRFDTHLSFPDCPFDRFEAGRHFHY